MLEHGTGAQIAQLRLDKRAQVPRRAVLHAEHRVQLIVVLDDHAGTHLCGGDRHPKSLLTEVRECGDPLRIVIPSAARDLLFGYVARNSRFLAPKSGARNDNFMVGNRHKHLIVHACRKAGKARSDTALRNSVQPNSSDATRSPHAFSN